MRESCSCRSRRRAGTRSSRTRRGRQELRKVDRRGAGTLPKRPWESKALDADAVKQALGDKAAKTHNALLLSDQIGPILASGAKGNPRQIKRFLNTLLLREKTATARGFGDDIKLPVLAKLMLLERFTPRLFDQIAAVAAAHPKGLCDDVAKLEAFATAAAAGVEKSAEPKAAKAAEAPSQPAEDSVA